MKYIEGTPDGVSLKDRLKTSKRLEFPLAIRFVLEALNGLIYAKRTINNDLSLPFIHRDIKPDNLLITKNGILKVTDFGLVMGRGGTPGYIPPEQSKGKEEEEKTDVYNLGLVLYEMLKGHLPHQGITRIEDIPAELNNLIIRCLAEAPDKRPGFVELRDELLKQTRELFPLQLEPELLSAEDLNARGSGFNQLGYYEKALECYNGAIALDPDDTRYYLNRGNVHLPLKNIERAKEDYQQALILDPECVEAYLGLGNIKVQCGEYENALKYYYHAENLSPQEPIVYASLGTLYAWQKLYDKAERYFKKSISIRDTWAEGYLGLGNVYLCQEDYRKAEVSYQKAISLNPLYYDAYLNLARLYQLMGHQKEREDMLKILTQLSHFYPEPNLRGQEK